LFERHRSDADRQHLPWWFDHVQADRRQVSRLAQVASWLCHLDGGIEDDLRRNVDGGWSEGGATIDSCSTIPRTNIPTLDDLVVMSVPEITYACMDAGRSEVRIDVQGNLCAVCLLKLEAMKRSAASFENTKGAVRTGTLSRSRWAGTSTGIARRYTQRRISGGSGRHPPSLRRISTFRLRFKPKHR